MLEPRGDAAGDVPDGGLDPAATLVDANGDILEINAAAAAIVDASPADLAGTNIVRHIHPDDREMAARLLDEAITQGRSGPVELRILMPDGGWVWLRCVSVREQSEDSQVRISLVEASEARRLADQLERTTQELQREHAELMRRSAAMADLARLLTGVDNVPSLIRGISGVAIRHLASMVAVLLIDEDGIRLEHLAHVDADAEALLRSSLAHLDNGAFALDGVISEAILAGEPQVNFFGPFHPELPDLLTQFHESFEVGAKAVFPMRTRQQWIGALIVARTLDEPEFSEEDIDLARMLAGRAALAVDSARTDALRREAEATSRRRATQQAAIAELGTLALAGEPLDELARLCGEKVKQALDVVHCGVLVADGSSEGHLVMASGADSAHETEARRSVDPALMAALKRDGAVIIDDIHAGTVYELNPQLEASGVRSLVASRIESRSGADGLLSAGASEPDAFSPDDVVFLAAMANVLASAIDARKALDDLHQLAMHDSLTGLPNRDLVMKSLDEALTDSGPSAQVAVLVCDVDRFKVINDALGHAAGDEVLKAVARRLAVSVRPGDTVGRFGGDEFVVVCPEVGHLDSVTAIARRLATTFAAPLVVAGTEVVATASIGIAISDGPGDQATGDLLRDADAAMYRAKENGRARYEIYDDGMRARASRRLRTETDLRTAFERGEITFHYQPIVALADQRLLGVEALARWQHPERGIVMPDDFIGVAVECGLAPELGELALESAALQAARWGESASVPGFIAVNLATQQLNDPGLLARIDGVLARTSVDPARLRIEVTEEVLVEDMLHAAQVLHAIRERGLGISIDDFGTGYSSLAYLKRLPVDCLKLDGEFVQKLGEDEDDMVIAAAVVVMAGALGFDVVAECVENVTQMQMLRAIGCGQVQGFHIAPPLSASDLEDWVAAGPALVD